MRRPTPMCQKVSGSRSNVSPATLRRGAENRANTAIDSESRARAGNTTCVREPPSTKTEFILHPPRDHSGPNQWEGGLTFAHCGVPVPTGSGFSHCSTLRARSDKKELRRTWLTGNTPALPEKVPRVCQMGSEHYQTSQRI